MIRVPKKLLEETKAIVRFYLFLRYECGLKYAEKLTAKDLKRILFALRK